MLNHEKNLDNLQLPIPLDFTQDFPILQYADDTLIFMVGNANQLSHLKNILQSFSISTGLKVNYSKSMLVLINMEDEAALSLSFGCTIGTLPFTYLGLPLGLSKPKVLDFLPIGGAP